MREIQTQRRFAVMGQNLFMLVDALTKSKELMRLLHYTDKNPLDPAKPEVDPMKLLHRNLLIVPKFLDEVIEKECFLCLLLDRFSLNSDNKDFKLSTVRIDIAVPFDEWIIEENSLRPYLIMEIIDGLLNEQRLAGIGKLLFDSAERLILSPELGGYSMEYTVNEFN